MFSTLKLAMIVIICGALASGGLYVKKIRDDLEIARANVAQMEVAVQTSEASLALERSENTRLNGLNSQLGENLQRAEQYGDELRNTLQKHNLTHLANKKPGLIEKRMQNATDKLWNDLTSITDPSRVQLDDAGTEDSDGY
jgi:hypothetical protein